MGLPTVAKVVNWRERQHLTLILGEESVVWIYNVFSWGFHRASLYWGLGSKQYPQFPKLAPT